MNNKYFDKFPIIETERLLLRAMSSDDLTGVYKFNSSIISLKYVARQPFENTEQAKDKLDFFINSFTEKTGIWWTFTLKPSDKLIGYGGLFGIEPIVKKAEIGYGLLEEHWRKGYMSEAVKAIVDFGFNKLDLNKIYGKIVPGNTASEKILEKLKFKKEGILHDDEFARGRYFDMQIFCRINK